RFLSGFLYFAAANAGRACAQALVRAIYDGPHRLQINVPAPVGDVVRVTDFVTKLRTFAANFANSCHLKETPGKMRPARRRTSSATLDSSKREVRPATSPSPRVPS